MPIELYEALGYVVLAVSLGAVGLVRMRREKRRLEGRDDKFTSLEKWAQQEGWQAYEAIDLRYAEQIERLTGLAGNFDGASSVSGETFTPSSVWEHAAVLVSGPKHAQCIVVDCWREGLSAEYVVAGLKVSQRFSEHFTANWKSGELEKTSELIAGETLESLFASLDWAYLVCIDDMIILVVEAPLSGPIAKSMATMLSGVLAAIPGVPGAERL